MRYIMRIYRKIMIFINDRHNKRLYRRMRCSNCALENICSSGIAECSLNETEESLDELEALIKEKKEKNKQL